MKLTTTSKVALIVGGIVLAGGLTYVFTRKKKGKEDSTTEGATNTDILSGILPSASTSTAVVEQGDDAAATKPLHQMLNHYHKVRVYLTEVSEKPVKVFAGWKPDANGNLLNDNQAFDFKTLEVLRFYFGKDSMKEADIFKNKQALERWDSLPVSDPDKNNDPIITAAGVGALLGSIFGIK